MKSLKIAIGVGGRFHADRMAAALLELGQEPKLFTSFPASKFPSLSQQRIVSSLSPEVAFRFLRSFGLDKKGSDLKMKRFGKMLASKVSKESWDVFVGWSSFSKETLKNRVAPRQIVMRDSSHITFQLDLLSQEYDKLDLPFSRDRMAEDRELEEYELADEIFVLSHFALKSFVQCGIPEKKIKVLRLGVDTSLFFAEEPTRDFKKGPLKVVYFGALSVRKGIHYLLDAAKKFKSDQIEFHCIGNIESDLKNKIREASSVRFYSAMPQKELARFLRKMDVFVFPTLEDGFGQTLIQAMASGLVPIFTPTSGASELVGPEEGIAVPAGNSEALAQAIHELFNHPERREFYRQKAIQRAQAIPWEAYRDRLSELFL